MNKRINIFIPAAGFGERLQPITLHIPKPLLPILGKPVLQIVLEKASTLPVNKIGINLHHKKELLEEWLKENLENKNTPLNPLLIEGKSIPFEKIIFFREETILGTGGALKNAETLLSEGAFLVHNSDVLSDIILESLLEHHLSSNNLVTLAVHDYPEFNNVIVDENGFVKAVGAGFKPAPADGKRTAFTGIAVYEPDFLKFLPEGASSVVDAWLKAVNAGQKIGTLDVSRGGFENRPYWSDLGTPEAYASAVFDALRNDGETVYIHPSTRGCKNINLQGYVVIEEGRVFYQNISLRNCILLPSSLTGGEIPSNAAFENCILGPDFKIDFLESEVLAATFEDGRKLPGAGGSDKKYYRIKRGKKSAVLMQCGRDDPDFNRQMEYTKFFRMHSIPVPEVWEVDFDEKSAVFEDAGDTSLYNWLKCPREAAEIERMYEKVIDALAVFHTAATDHVSDCPLLKNRIFDYEYFRWETDYFVERFIEDIKGIKTADDPTLKSELNRLAFLADSFPKTVIHRDFQSQNVMVPDDGSLRIIDYQGARMAPPAYDVASLLWDPYYRLEDHVRERLVNYYFRKIEDTFDEENFRESLRICRLQRHMQALGAYGFLSSVKGKKYFLKYVPEGLRLLKEDIALVKDDYPELYKVIMRL
ncbi:MAG: phosphotransferase [Nitrospirae bacterium]|nr:phosphotransferase [Nitrospirota bacterium]